MTSQVEDGDLPPGAEPLPAPYDDFFVLEQDGEIELRFAAKGSNPRTESRKIVLPVWIPIWRGRPRSRSLAEIFLARYPVPLPKPNVLRLHTAWEHKCGAVIWERGSEEGMLGDLAAVSGVFGRKHGEEISAGTAFFYGESGTPSNEPKFSYASYDFVMRGDYNVIAANLQEFIAELQRLETGLFARNRPVGCGSYNSKEPHIHVPMRLFLPVLRHDSASNREKFDHGPDLAAADAARYAEIERASSR